MNNNYGIEGHQAPELAEFSWIDGQGKNRTPIKLSDYFGKFDFKIGKIIKDHLSHRVKSYVYDHKYEIL